MFLKKSLNILILSLGITVTGVAAKRSLPDNSILTNGIWQGQLLRDDGQKIIFNFQVIDSADRKVIYILNAGNRLRVDQVQDRGDSVNIRMPFFDSYFSLGAPATGTLSGYWIKNYGTRILKMKFEARHGVSDRILSFAPADKSVDGSWETTMAAGDHDLKAIGLLKQEDNKVTGTFLTPSGDFRYLEGVVSGDTLKLSGFDGSYAILFTALVGKNDSVITNGRIYSTNSPARDWSAVRKEYKTLPKAYAVNNIAPGKVKINFKLRDMNTGKMVSLKDARFKGKVVIISILGSWCPNCMDEAPFLIDYLAKNKSRGVEILGVDFERTSDFETSKKALASFLNRFDINYPILFSGVAASDQDLTKKVFPGLPDKIHAFPTTIFIDKSGYVRKIHSGFNGPATGKYYDEFKEEFEGIVNGMLAE